MFHISLLKRFREDEDNMHQFGAPPEPVIIGDDVEYEVESILDKRMVWRQLQYLVKWKGFPYYEASWEPSSHLENCGNLIIQFENSVMSP